MRWTAIDIEDDSYLSRGFPDIDMPIEYRPSCRKCEWKGLWWMDSESAKAQGVGHYNACTEAPDDCVD